MRFKHIIWDYDGTLFDSYPVMASAFSDLLRERGIDEPVNTVVSLMKVSMGHARQYYKDKYRLDDAFFDRFKVLAADAECKNTKLFDGAWELCHAVCEHGGHNYLLTHRGGSAVHFIEKAGLSVCFTELVTSENGFQRKPSPDGIIYLLQKHGISHDEALMIGDRDLDILAAINAGIHSCYFTEGNGPCDIAEFNIDRFSELYEILGIG